MSRTMVYEETPASSTARADCSSSDLVRSTRTPLDNFLATLPLLLRAGLFGVWDLMTAVTSPHEESA